MTSHRAPLRRSPNIQAADIQAEPVWAEQVQVRGVVQGVGFRPFVWQLAQRFKLQGHVFNDLAGVSIEIWGTESQIGKFHAALRAEAPPLSDIQSVERSTLWISSPSSTTSMPTESRELLRPKDFQILASPPNDSFSGSSGDSLAQNIRSHRGNTAISPDIVSCPACCHEVCDPKMRRYRYPFTNCTHCGPRLTIIRELPYDRERTTMASFVMCPECKAEYQDPADRRYHAQPIACPACGPRCWLSSATGEELSPWQFADTNDSIAAAAELLRQGQILAIKGLGGFQLACDASNSQAVERLRLRKVRPHKPFAVMVCDLSLARAYCDVPDAAAQLLQNPHGMGPIVLLLRQRQPPNDLPLAAALAPGLNELGVMLPTTPLHLLLLRDFGGPLVMTSGNLSDEPQAIDNRAALEKLRGIADYWLLHDRKILCRVDDSVIRSHTGYQGVESSPGQPDFPLQSQIQTQILRLARGYAPRTLTLPSFLAGGRSSEPILAFGAQGKACFAFLNNSVITLSQYFGDITEAGNWSDFQQNLQHYRQLYHIQPKILCCDQHPEYINSQYAKQQGFENQEFTVTKIQHHHAHIAACMAEHQLEPQTLIGVVFDGLGYGNDSWAEQQQCHLWGAEFFLADYCRTVRIASLEPIPLLGRQLAAQEPWRCLLAWLLPLCPSYGCDATGDTTSQIKQLSSELQQLTSGHRLSHCLPPLAPDQLHILLRTLQPKISKASRNLAPLSSSAGRLFDAVAALLLSKPSASGAGYQTSYESQAAIELEALAQGYLLEQGLLNNNQPLLCKLTTLDKANQPLQPYPYDIGHIDYTGDTEKADTQDHSATPKPEDKFMQLRLGPMWRTLLSDCRAQKQDWQPGHAALRFHLTLAQAVCDIVLRIAAAHRSWSKVGFHSDWAPNVVLSGGVFQNGLLLCLCRELLQQQAPLVGQIYSPAEFPANDNGLALGQAVIAAARYRKVPK